jgi:hypothetical protein
MNQSDHRAINLGLPDNATSELHRGEFEKAWDSLSKLPNEATQEPGPRLQGTQVQPYFPQGGL